MTNNQLTEIAKLLGVSEDSITALDENFRADMVTALTEKSTDKTALYNELDRLWQKGSVYIELAEIARNTGISIVAMHSLDYSTQQELVFEYMADSSQTERFYEIVNRELAVLEIERIAHMVGVPVTRLRSLPRDMQERICGIYAMEYDEDSTNAELIANIRNIIEEAE
ncbi:MAG: hypothetical protein II685_04000 [Clostridia bacterium]|nr:hypothetical protein [Clostridia bacterium]